MTSVYGVMHSNLTFVLPPVNLQESLAKASAELAGALKQIYSVSLQAFQGGEIKTELNNDQFYRDATRQIAAATTKPTLSELRQHLGKMIDSKTHEAKKSLETEISNLFFARMGRIMGIIFNVVLTGGLGTIGGLLGGPFGALGGVAVGIGIGYAVYKKDCERIEEIRPKIDELDQELQGLEIASGRVQNDLTFTLFLNSHFANRGTSPVERAQALIDDLNSQ